MQLAPVYSGFREFTLNQHRSRHLYLRATLLARHFAQSPFAVRLAAHCRFASTSANNSLGEIGGLLSLRLFRREPAVGRATPGGWSSSQHRVAAVAMTSCHGVFVHQQGGCGMCKTACFFFSWKNLSAVLHFPHRWYYSGEISPRRS